jgi:hypothetical protein
MYRIDGRHEMPEETLDHGVAGQRDPEPCLGRQAPLPTRTGREDRLVLPSHESYAIGEPYLSGIECSQGGSFSTFGPTISIQKIAPAVER